MIIGISMGLETCLILGQVSLDLFYWKKNLQTHICGPGEINEKTDDIQARSFIAQVLLALWTRSTTTEFQHNDIMMKTTVHNDLRLEMGT